jgi:hypothetical protein
MGSPLSSVIANHYMEYFEVHVLDTAILKPSCWFRCADDTFVIWTHDLQELQNFFYCVNSKPSNIQFTMEEERKVTWHSTQHLLERSHNGVLGLQSLQEAHAYWLILECHFPPPSGPKFGILPALRHMANISNAANLHIWLADLRRIFKENE